METQATPDEIDSTALTLLEQTALTLLERAGEIQVVDQPSFERADELYDDFSAQEKRINAVFEPLRAARYESYQRVQKLQKERIDLLGPGKILLKAKSKAYLDEQARLRREAEETARREREAVERAAQAARELERRRLRREAEEAALAAALRAEQSGDGAVAAAILEQPIVVDLPMIEPEFTAPAFAEAPKVDLRKYGKKWKARVMDPRLACRAIADGVVSARLVEFKASELANLAKSLGGVREIPGFEFFED